MILKFLSFWSTFIGLIDVGYNYTPNLWTLFCGHLTLEIEDFLSKHVNALNLDSDKMCYPCKHVETLSDEKF